MKKIQDDLLANKVSPRPAGSRHQSSFSLSLTVPRLPAGPADRRAGENAAGAGSAEVQTWRGLLQVTTSLTSASQLITAKNDVCAMLAKQSL